jgi:hypothetical protein
VDVFHRFIVFFHHPQGAVEKSLLPEFPALPPPDVDADHRAHLYRIKHCRNGEGIQGVNNSMPVIRQKHPGGDGEAVLPPHASEEEPQT